MMAVAVVSVAVVGSYLHALGADRDVEHARAMALAVLLVSSAAMATGLTGLRSSAARWLVGAALLSLGVLVQVPSLGAWLSLRPLHAADWVVAFAAYGPVWAMVRALAARLRRTNASPDPTMSATTSAAIAAPASTSTGK